MPNLAVLGFRPYEEVEQYFDRCAVLVSTSEREGFPNVFLQAMRRGIPIVSFVDPDSIIGANPDLGVVVGSEAELESAVRRLGQQPLLPAAPIHAYFAQHFGPESVADKYRALLNELQA